MSVSSINVNLMREKTPYLYVHVSVVEYISHINNISFLSRLASWVKALLLDYLIYMYMKHLFNVLCFIYCRMVRYVCECIDLSASV